MEKRKIIREDGRYVLLYDGRDSKEAASKSASEKSDAAKKRTDQLS